MDKIQEAKRIEERVESCPTPMFTLKDSEVK